MPPRRKATPVSRGARRTKSTDETTAEPKAATRGRSSSGNVRRTASGRRKGKELDSPAEAKAQTGQPNKRTSTPARNTSNGTTPTSTRGPARTRSRSRSRATNGEGDQGLAETYSMMSSFMLGDEEDLAISANAVRVVGKPEEHHHQRDENTPKDLLEFETAMEQPWTKRPRAREYRLGTIDEVASWNQDNPHILTGYRLRYTARMCFASFFHIHNETGNVWTHFLGLLLFLTLATFVYLFVLEKFWTHWIVFTFFMGACSMCMACSCIYHLFNCHYNERIAMMMLKMDLLGIAVLIVASFVPLLHFAFACLPQWRIVYLTMIGILGSAGILAPFVPLDPEHDIYRKLLFVAIAVSGMFPTIHIALGFPLGGPLLAPLGGVALMFLLYACGLIFYLSKIPERWYPGHFDYWLQSHQIWHLFVVAAAVVHFFACVGLYQRYQHMGGDIC